MGEVPEISGGQRSSDWWYYFKKSFTFYPGISNYVCADFLNEYYEHQKSNLTLLGRARNALVYGGHQIWAPLRAWQVARKYGLGKDWMQNASHLSRKCFLDPNDMAWFRVETPEQAQKLLRRYEYAAVNKLINPRNWEADCVLGNKIAFHNICQREGISHPQILATALKGDVKIFGSPDDNWLAIKPSGGEGGRGFALARLNGSGGDMSTAISEAMISKSDNRDGGWLAQKRLVNHSALKPIAQSALITARFVTMLDETGKPELIASVMRFPSDPDILVDNLKAGGLMAKINIETGRLEKACFGRGAHDIDVHPVSGVQLKGLKIPYVKEAGDLVRQAHRKGFLDYSLVGWDIVITDDGPLILEGNGKPGIDITQRGMWANAGETRFGELIAFHVSRRVREINQNS